MIEIPVRALGATAWMALVLIGACDCDDKKKGDAEDLDGGPPASPHSIQDEIIANGRPCFIQDGLNSNFPFMRFHL